MAPGNNSIFHLTVSLLEDTEETVSVRAQSPTVYVHMCELILYFCNKNVFLMYFNTKYSIMCLLFK